MARKVPLPRCIEDKPVPSEAADGFTGEADIAFELRATENTGNLNIFTVYGADLYLKFIPPRHTADGAVIDPDHDIRR